VTSDEGKTYSTGALVTQPFDALKPIRLEFPDGGPVELFPGGILKVGKPRSNESGRFILDEGRLVVDMRTPGLRLAIEAHGAEIGTTGGRLFMELYGSDMDYRLRVGMFDGSADMTTYEGEATGLSAGEAVYLNAGMNISPLMPPSNDWPARCPRLNRWVFPGLTIERQPSVAQLIKSACKQAGLRMSLAEESPFADLPVPDDLLGAGAVRVTDILDDLALRCGFGYGIHNDEVLISPLTEHEHIAAVGEKVIFSHPEKPDIAFPMVFPHDEPVAFQQRLASLASLSAAPIEDRIGALAVLVAGRRELGGTFVNKTVDLEWDIAFDMTQPQVLRRFAFEDLYANADVPPELIVPLLEKAGLESARDYFRLRAWGPPAWADGETAAKMDEMFNTIIESSADKVGTLFSEIALGSVEYAQLARHLEEAFFAMEPELRVDMAHHFYNLARRTPGHVDPAFINVALKRVFTMGGDYAKLLAIDGAIQIAGRIERDYQLLLLIGNHILTPDSPITAPAAEAMGVLMGLNLQSEDEKWVDERAGELKDPDGEMGPLALYILGALDGLKTHPGLGHQKLLSALEARLGLVSEPDERLRMLRLLRAHRIGLVGAEGLGWAVGPAADALADMLATVDSNYLVEAILSLGLTEPAPPSLAFEPGGLRREVDKAFISFAAHSDARLRLLAAEYFQGNRPAGRDEALKSLADDEYPAIADAASEALADIQ
jgi:hypothetical protein